jgi:hypothetical protein
MPSYNRVAQGRHYATVLDERPGVRVMKGMVAPPYSPTELSSAWLGLIFNEQRRPDRGMARGRVPYRKAQLEFLSWPEPNYFIGGRVEGDFSYIDGHRMFFQLYRGLTLDTYYNPDGPDTSIGLGRFRFLEADQMADAPRLTLQAVSGMFRALRCSQWHKGDPVYLFGPQWNRYLSPGLWGVMSDTLHAIAGDALGFGAVYVKCDGWMVPADRADAFVAHLASAWNLEVTVKASGPSVITAIGRWQVGELRSMGGPGLASVGTSNLRPISDGRRAALQRIRDAP